LSSWLRDYLYIPLGGNRKGPFRTNINLFLTMLLGGLWHGASWNFVLWGAFHGLILILYRIFEKHPDDRDPWGNCSRIPVVLGKMALMFCLTLFGWMLFACKSFEQIRYFCTNAFTGQSSPAAYTTGQIVSDLIFFVSPLLVMQLLQYTTRDLMVAMRLPLVGRAGLIAIVIVATAIFGNRASTEFIYFQF
jgi:alginate O-acetyltransferase complex protein AlgI